jgi:CHAT domain-containing protein
MRHVQLRKFDEAAVCVIAAVQEINEAYPSKSFPNGHEDIAIVYLRAADVLTLAGRFDHAERLRIRGRALLASAFAGRPSFDALLISATFDLGQARNAIEQRHYRDAARLAEAGRKELDLIPRGLLATQTARLKNALLITELDAASQFEEDTSFDWDSIVVELFNDKFLDDSSKERLLARTLVYQAETLLDKGKNLKAIQKLVGATVHSSRIAGQSREGAVLRARTTTLLGYALSKEGRYRDALGELRNARQQIEDLHSRKRPDYLFTSEYSAAVARCAEGLGNPHIIEELLPDVVAQLEGIQPKSFRQSFEYLHTSLVVASNRIGAEHPSTLVRRAISRTGNHLEEHDRLLILAYLVLAQCELDEGNMRLAAEALARSRAGGHLKRAKLVAWSFLIECELALLQGRPNDASQVLRNFQALEKQTEISTLNRLQAAKLARVIFLESGQHDKAAEYAQKAFDLYLEHLEQLVSETSSSEYQRKKRVARVILDALLADGIEAKVSPDELRRAVRRYYETEFAIAPVKQGEQDELLTRQRELESIWQASLLKSPLKGKVAEQNVTLLEIARLERGTLFIPKSPERNGTQHAERQTEWLVHRMQNGEHSFLVLFHQNEDGETEMVLIEMKAFEERLSGWRKSLVNNNESQDDLLWISRQLSPLLNNVHEHLQIVGDPVAYEVPWSALLVGEQRLVERASVAVSHAPSAKRPQTKINRSSAVLLVGDVRFPSEGPLEPLPFSREEVLRIATHFESPKLALGATPTRKWTLDMLAESEVAHLATHGIGRSTVRNLGQGNSPLLGEAPFLGSGLLLAGASARQADLLTAATVASLKLPQLKLVVLSSCESGVTAGSEAAYALPRAFHLAGCQTVVSTQWPVDDLATSVLMQLFYANLVAEQMKPAEAMRQAQLTVLRYPGRLDELAKLRGPDFTQAAKRLNKNAGTKAKIASPRLWAGFIVSHGGGR